MRTAFSKRGLILHVFLLLVVAGEVLYLSSFYRARVDVTADQLYSFSPSTLGILDRLEEPIRIEAYFSAVENLDDAWRDARGRINSFLDELVRVSRGKLTIEFFDPGAEQQIEDRARRVGIQSLNLSRVEAGVTQVAAGWQGLRFRYGTKVEVLPLIPPSAAQPPQLEAQITPLLELVTTEELTKVAFFEWPYQPPGRGGQRPPPIGWAQLRNSGYLPGRYRWIDMAATDGLLVPDDVDVLVLFCPRNLDKRTKYVIDQHLMRGGTVLAFVDAHAFQYATTTPLHPFTPDPTFRFDAIGHERGYAFVDQMDHYGLVIHDDVVGEGADEALETFEMPIEPGRSIKWPFPFFLHPLHYDWTANAEQFARDAAGNVDLELLERYRERFVSGMNPTSEFARPFLESRVGPGFYFPTRLELRDPLPDGIEAEVHFRTTPVAMGVPSQQPLDWIGAIPQRMVESFRANRETFLNGLRGEPRQQHPLMVELSGAFTSFFADKVVPYRPGFEPVERGPEPAPQDPDAIGPAVPAPDPGPDKDAERPILKTSAPGARLVVVADADGVRDDLISERYRSLGGPTSRAGLTLFAQTLDVLSGDRDLLALYERFVPDRGQSYGTRDTANEPVAAFERRVQRTVWWWRAANVVVPILCLVVVAVVVSVRRRREKVRFLRATQQLKTDGGVA